MVNLFTGGKMQIYCSTDALPTVALSHYKHKLDLSQYKRVLENAKSGDSTGVSYGKGEPYMCTPLTHNFARVVWGTGSTKYTPQLWVHKNRDDLVDLSFNGGSYIKVPEHAVLGRTKHGRFCCYPKDDPRCKDFVQAYSNQAQKMTKDTPVPLDKNKLPMLDLAGMQTIFLEEHKDLILGLKPGETLGIGRNPMTDKYIRTEDNLDISRRHVTITNNNGKFYLTDHSSNGPNLFECAPKTDMRELISLKTIVRFGGR